MTQRFLEANCGVPLKIDPINLEIFVLCSLVPFLALRVSKSEEGCFVRKFVLSFDRKYGGHSTITGYIDSHEIQTIRKNRI